VNALIISFTTAVVIALINIGSATAFNSVTSLGTGTLTISYIISIACIIWRKLCGKPLLPSRFNMGRRVGLAVNILAVAFLCLVFVIAFFPPIPLPLLTVVSMNWVSDETFSPCIRSRWLTLFCLTVAADLWRRAIVQHELLLHLWQEAVCRTRGVRAEVGIRMKRGVPKIVQSTQGCL
jgi:amino acid transporter